MRPVGARRQVGTGGDSAAQGPIPREKWASPGPRVPLAPGHRLASEPQLPSSGGHCSRARSPTQAAQSCYPLEGGAGPSLQCQTPACQLS